MVNEEDRVEGVVSLSDILAFLVLRPLGKESERARVRVRVCVCFHIVNNCRLTMATNM